VQEENVKPLLYNRIKKNIMLCGYISDTLLDN